ncbi:MOSC domain-containing protein [Lysobacter sp. N42]|nr:MOSC domain-containing protein [Lysobacter sp. N42]
MASARRRPHRPASRSEGVGDNASMRIASLHLHPLKSCAPLDVDMLEITPRGPAGDRRWLVVDADARFVTGRQHGAMVGIRARPARDGLQLDAPGMPGLHVPTPPADAPRLDVAIWRDVVDAQRCGAEADAWLSRYLGMPVRLVHMDETSRRAVDPDFATPGDVVSFADAYPLLVISQAALDALNTRLPQPVPMARFRPNLVVEGCAPHAEDGWRRVRIGEVEFEAVKPCTRCVFTTIDPATMARDPGGEPLRTLATYRRAPAGSGLSGVLFGMNLIPRGTGTVRRGDAVTMLA